MMSKLWSLFVENLKAIWWFETPKRVDMSVILQYRKVGVCFPFGGVPCSLWYKLCASKAAEKVPRMIAISTWTPFWSKQRSRQWCEGLPEADTSRWVGKNARSGFPCSIACRCSRSGGIFPLPQEGNSPDKPRIRTLCEKPRWGFQAIFLNLVKSQKPVRVLQLQWRIDMDGWMDGVSIVRNRKMGFFSDRLRCGFFGVISSGFRSPTPVLALEDLKKETEIRQF